MQSPQLVDVHEAAAMLRVSESWIRRHICELPVVRLGRLVRLDSGLLLQQVQRTISDGKSLKPERTVMPYRYQRGSIIKRGNVWYGVYREDVSTEAGLKRLQKWVRLGGVAELPTKNTARDKLGRIMGSSAPSSTAITFEELSNRWMSAEGPTLKVTTLNHYSNALRAYLVPAFGQRKIVDINREDIQVFLAQKAKQYSQSALRSMRVVLGLTLGWARDNAWIEKNPCQRIKLPKETGGRKVIRTVLAPEQIAAIAAKLHEPYATLVLLLAATGIRIGEAIALKWTDIDGNVLKIARRLYNRDVDTVKSLRSARTLPIEAELTNRMRVLGEGHEWVFRSEAGTPVNPGNALRRYIRPAAMEVGVTIGGWHDFRHTLSTTLRRSGVHPKVVSDILGHTKVNLAMDTYDRTDLADLTAPLAAVSTELLASVSKPAGNA